VLGDQARQDVVSAAGREWHHDGHRVRRISLRRSRAYAGGDMRRREACDEGPGSPEH
jgi:hypothetical protein